MLVKDILKLSADYLDLKELKEYLTNDNGEQDSDAIVDELNNLLLAVNMVNTNLATNYFELVNTVRYSMAVKELEFSKLCKDGVIEIKSVVGREGNELKYELLSDKFKVDQLDFLTITFSHFPAKVNIDSEINYYPKLNDITFAMGVVAEFLFMKGAIDDAYMWDKRFKSALFAITRSKRNIVMLAREWV